MWWQSQEEVLRRSGRGEVATWVEMKDMFRSCFLPSNYTQQLCQKFYKLKQGDRMTLAQYIESFYNLATRSRVFEAQDVLAT